MLHDNKACRGTDTGALPPSATGFASVGVFPAVAVTCLSPLGDVHRDIRLSILDKKQAGNVNVNLFFMDKYPIKQTNTPESRLN